MDLGGFFVLFFFILPFLTSQVNGILQTKREEREALFCLFV